MFGLLLYSAVVLSAVTYGSASTLSAMVQLNVSSDPTVPCMHRHGSRCLPYLYAHFTVMENNRAVAENFASGEVNNYRPKIYNITFPDIVKDNTHLPALLRVLVTLNISCPYMINLEEIDCYDNISSIASIVALIKVPKFSVKPEHVEAQLSFGDLNVDHFKWSSTVFLNYDDSKGSECVDIGSDQDFCPPKLPFSCPIFSGPGFKNPCCEVNVESSCMLRNESNIKTTTTTTTTIPTTTTTTPTTTIPATTTPITTTTDQPTTTTDQPTTTTDQPTTTVTIPTTSVQPDSTLTTTAELPSKYTTNEATGSTPATSTTTANVTATDCPKTQQDDVYYWLTIEFVLISIILLVGFIVLAVFYKRLKKKFEEGEGSDEGDPQ